MDYLTRQTLNIESKVRNAGMPERASSPKGRTKSTASGQARYNPGLALFKEISRLFQYEPTFRLCQKYMRA